MKDYYSISKMAAIAGCDRRTMSAIVGHVKPEKETTNFKGYSFEQILKLLIEGTRPKNVDELSPSDQLAYWNAQLKQLEYKKRRGEVCEVEDASRQMSIIVKTMLQPQETLADRAEVAGMPINWVIWIQKEVDKNRDESADLILEDETDVCESE
ncbi:TPA: DUF1441 family protein [Haemophilus influenzae]|uniref:DUF1441 family protein n=1 Tax=Haemophilus TaxID=724 RepID=UPI000E0A7037|nr:DUF1441 family protein [Haemophilus influenzae]NKB86347.1 DUF1441 family protein [Haemophilus influenzae]BCR38594.1 hypothetical protein TA8730_12080 [Haemophilus influenzae]VTP75558.1 Protein of uncharacterised function (DUF1441) [Haemophilus influenzae]